MGNLFKRSLLFNLLLALILFGVLIIILFSSLSIITKHGQDAKVPIVIGHKLKLAQKELSGFEIQVDSVYMPYKIIQIILLYMNFIIYFPKSSFF